MSECTHDCDHCSAECASREGGGKESFLAPPNPLSKVGKVIGVVSGKGGVGKSMVTASLAVAARKKGYNVAILDADITGPSIPKMFGASEMAEAMDEENILPVATATGIRLMSLNLLVEDATEPVIWRGPILAGTVKQFWTNVAWGEVDYMFVDMPPGTGDVPLTVFQSLPLDGIVIVTSPQELVSLIVAKATRMANMMNIPILGIVENMSYFECPDCGKRHYLFGKSRIDETAKKYSIGAVAKLPLDPRVAELADAGKAEELEPSEELWNIVAKA